MCRLNRVAKSRKPHICRKCGQEIGAGEPYVWFQFRRDSQSRDFHDTDACRPKPYERESNDRQRTIEEGRYNAESVVAGASDVESLVAALRDMGEVLEGVIEEYQESMDNMPEQFQGTSDVYLNMEERVQELEDWRDELERVADELEEEDEPGETEDEDGEESEEAWEKFEGLRDQASEALSQG